MTTIPKTMKAAVLMDSNQLEIKEVPTPKPGPMEVLLKVASCACCSTDVRLWTNRFPGSHRMEISFPVMNMQEPWRPWAKR